MSTRNIESFLPFYPDAERMLCEKFNFTPRRAKKLVIEAMASYMTKPHYKIDNPKRVLLRLVRKWAVQGKPKRPR